MITKFKTQFFTNYKKNQSHLLSEECLDGGEVAAVVVRPHLVLLVGDPSLVDVRLPDELQEVVNEAGHAEGRGLVHVIEFVPAAGELL